MSGERHAVVGTGGGLLFRPYPGAQARLLELPDRLVWDESGPSWADLEHQAAARATGKPERLLAQLVSYSSLVCLSSPRYRGRVSAADRAWWGRKKPRKRGRLIRKARRRGEAWAMTRGYL